MKDLPKLSFNMIDEKMTVFETVNGYRVEQVDTGVWNATYQGEPISGSPFLSRVRAFEGCSKHFNDEPTHLTARGVTCIAYLIGVGGEAIYTDLVKATQLPTTAALNTIRLLTLSSCVTECDGKLTLTTHGRASYEAMANGARYGDGRVTAQEKRFGPKPDYARPVTRVEVLEADLAVAEAQLQRRTLERAVRPYSDNAIRAVARQETKVSLLKATVELAKEEQAKAIADGLPIPSYGRATMWQLPTAKEIENDTDECPDGNT